MGRSTRTSRPESRITHVDSGGSPVVVGEVSCSLKGPRTPAGDVTLNSTSTIERSEIPAALMPESESELEPVSGQAKSAAHKRWDSPYTTLGCAGKSAIVRLLSDWQSAMRRQLLVTLPMLQLSTYLDVRFVRGRPRKMVLNQARHASGVICELLFCQKTIGRPSVITEIRSSMPWARAEASRRAGGSCSGS